MTERKTVEEIIEVQESTKLDEEERKWCVYMHTSPSGKKYIGITSNKPERRFDHGNGYLKKKKNDEYCQPAIAYAILKYPDFDNDWKHEILYDKLTKTDAEHKEIQLISQYQTRDPRYGYNITPGGSVLVGKDNPTYGKNIKDFLSEEQYHQWKTNISLGVSKFYKEHPEECEKQREKTKKLWENEEFRKMMSNRMSGENNPNYKGRAFDEGNYPMQGKNHSEETKQKIREARLGKNTGIDNVTSKPIYCKELDRIFWGSTQVYNEFGISAPHISDCCRGKRKHAGVDPNTNIQLSWLFCKDYEDRKGKPIIGAISLGYITQNRLDEYLNNLKEKGNDK